MPKFDFTAVRPLPKQKSWKETIVERLKEGKVVPLLSNALLNELAFGSHAALVQGWAHYTGYPQAGAEHDLPRMAQYQSVNKAADGQVGDEVQVKEEYLLFLKAALASMAAQDPQVSADRRADLADQAAEFSVSRMAHFLNYPGLESPQANPLLLLAGLPLPVYVTTSYHDFLEVALREKAGKAPRTEICRWHEGLQPISSVFEEDRDYTPSSQEPLVYHLFGFDAYPESLVLTEDDYMEFLANSGGAIHPRVMQALTQASLLMVGYSLRSWDFRVLLCGVVKARPPGLWKTSVALQLEASPDERDYLQKYLRQVKFEVEWADAYTFIAELYQAWGG